jgi:hypothetical protein
MNIRIESYSLFVWHAELVSASHFCDKQHTSIHTQKRMQREGCFMRYCGHSNLISYVKY